MTPVFVRRNLSLLCFTIFLSLLTACTTARRSAKPEDTGPPRRGGTLKIVGTSDVDHLSTTSAYTTASLWLFRAFARQLVSYPPGKDFETAITIVPDLADTVPSTENGGISADGLTYTFHIRKGAKWDTNPARQVTALDQVRGFDMMCNPVNPTGAPGYYESTIVGMQKYCDDFAKVPGTVEDIRRYIEAHQVEGVKALDEQTVVIHLVQPTPDFLNLIAMPFTSPIPAEYLAYLPDGPDFRQHTISDGPYRIVKYTPNHGYQFERNPAWSADADPLRPAYVDRITVTLGIDQQLGQLQLEAGTADLELEQTVPVAELGSLLAIGDPNLLFAPPGDAYGTLIYLVTNVVDPNEGGALKDVKVRQAIEYAINKVADVQVLGGPAVARPLRQAVLSGGSGFDPNAVWYATPNDRGDPARTRKLLAEAGYPHGLTLKLAYPTSSWYPIIAASVQASLAAAGLRVELQPFTAGDYYSRVMPNPENAKRGMWDMGVVAWVPDWFGPTNGRSILEPVFDGRHFGTNSYDFGGYNDNEVNSSIDRATTALTPEESVKAWNRAAAKIMSDAAIIPLAEAKWVTSHSPRTRDCMVDIFGLNCYITSAWLQDKP